MPIKVLHLISNKTGIGGAEKFLLDMSGEYDTEIFDISYCTIFSEGENLFVNELRKRNLECFEIKGKTIVDLPQTIKKLVEFMRRKQFDVVHTQLLHGSIAGQVAARIAKVPFRVITRQYTTDCYHDGHKYIARMDKYVAKKANRVIAISESVKNDLIKNEVKPQNIDLIYNGIDLKPFKELTNASEIREMFPGKFLIGFVANLNYRKGHKYLLRAISLLKEEFDDIQLVLLGEGDLRSELEKMTVELGIKDNVSFLGYQKNVPGILKELDLYVHASTLEPLGIAILEAMAAGKCVIATEVGGIPEIIQNGKNGFLVPPADAEAIANAIKNVRNSKEGANSIGLIGQKRIYETFDIKVITEHYQNVYLELAYSH